MIDSAGTVTPSRIPLIQPYKLSLVEQSEDPTVSIPTRLQLDTYGIITTPLSR